MTQLTCGQARPLLEPYVDGSLDGETAAAVRSHLAGCADCQNQHLEAVSIPARLRALTAPEPPADLLPSVMAAVARVRRPRFAWGPLILEIGLCGLIAWYLSGLAGLSALFSYTSGELSDVVGWGLGTTQLPAAPSLDLLLVLACLALVTVTGYHLALIIGATSEPSGRRAGQG